MLAGVIFPMVRWSIEPLEKFDPLLSGHAWRFVDLEFRSQPHGPRCYRLSELESLEQVVEELGGECFLSGDSPESAMSIRFQKSGRMLFTASCGVISPGFSTLKIRFA